jgi:hypothetical protein
MINDFKNYETSDEVKRRQLRLWTIAEHTERALLTTPLVTNGFSCDGNDL